MEIMKREVIDASQEMDIITAVIMNDEVCHAKMEELKAEHFEAREIRTIFTWVKKYYFENHKAPRERMVRIHQDRQAKMESAEWEVIGFCLEKLSDRYVLEGEDVDVAEAVKDIDNFLVKRDAEILEDKIHKLNMKGDHEKVHELVGSVLVADDVEWYHPLDPKIIAKTHTRNYENELFRLPGKLNELIGSPVERGWLIAYMGPMKKGKSWYLLNLAFEALSQKKKVAYISMEMSDIDVNRRIEQMFTAGANREGEIIEPMFDCRWNQLAEDCGHEQRKNHNPLPLKNEDVFPQFDPGLLENYQPCSYCRERGLPDFYTSIWYSMKNPELVTPERVRIFTQKFQETFKSNPIDNLWMINPPQQSINIDGVDRIIERLVNKFQFVPDVICIDYLDITAPEKEYGLSPRDQLDMKWRKAKGMAQRRKALVATVTQTNRGGITKDNIDELDTAEDIRKLATVDLIMTLNQTHKEKQAGLMRIGILNFRHEEANFANRIWVLQNLRTGRPFMDSEYDVEHYRRFHGWTKPKGVSRKPKSRKDIDD